MNVGVKLSRGTLLILNHSDVIPISKPLANIWFKHDAYTRQGKELLYRTSRLISSSSFQDIGSNIMPTGSSLPRKLYDLIGGFDEEFNGYGPTSVDFSQRIIYGQKDLGCTWIKDLETIYLHISQAKIPIRGGYNEANDLLHIKNLQNRKWKANPGGWGKCSNLVKVI